MCERFLFGVLVSIEPLWSIEQTHHSPRFKKRVLFKIYWCETHVKRFWTLSKSTGPLAQKKKRVFDRIPDFLCLDECASIF